MKSWIVSFLELVLTGNISVSHNKYTFLNFLKTLTYDLLKYFCLASTTSINFSISGIRLNISIFTYFP